MCLQWKPKGKYLIRKLVNHKTTKEAVLVWHTLTISNITTFRKFLMVKNSILSHYSSHITEENLLEKYMSGWTCKCYLSAEAQHKPTHFTRCLLTTWFTTTETTYQQHLPCLITQLRHWFTGCTSCSDFTFSLRHLVMFACVQLPIIEQNKCTVWLDIMSETMTSGQCE